MKRCFMVASLLLFVCCPAFIYAQTTDNNLLLLKTNMGAGHSGSSGRYDALHETAFDHAFMLN